MKAKHNAHGMHFCTFMDHIFPPLWIIFNIFIPVIYVSTSVLCIIEYVSKPSALFQNVLNLSVLKMLTLICFPEVKAACLEFHIFPANVFASPSWSAGIYYKLQLHVLPFVIHQTRQTHWNIAVVLPVAWMRLTGTFLGLQ